MGIDAFIPAVSFANTRKKGTVGKTIPKKNINSKSVAKKNVKPVVKKPLVKKPLVKKPLVKKPVVPKKTVASKIPTMMKKPVPAKTVPKNKSLSVKKSYKDIPVVNLISFGANVINSPKGKEAIDTLVTGGLT